MNTLIRIQVPFGLVTLSLLQQATAALTLAEAEKISQRTGRPIFAVAGTST